jgi:hypothetical protein
LKHSLDFNTRKDFVQDSNRQTARIFEYSSVTLPAGQHNHMDLLYPAYIRYYYVFRLSASAITLFVSRRLSPFYSFCEPVSYLVMADMDSRNM